MEGRAVKLEIQLLSHTFTFSEPQVVREILALIQNICFSLILLFFLAYAEFQTFNDAKNYAELTNSPQNKGKEYVERPFEFP